MTTDRASLRLVLACVSLALFAVHEMDAMVHREWVLLPVFSVFGAEHAQLTFVLSHIPLFAGLSFALFVWGRRMTAITVFHILLITHATAHALLSGHPDYTFAPPVETITVFGAGLVGAIDLVWSRLKGSE